MILELFDFFLDKPRATSTDTFQQPRTPTHSLVENRSPSSPDPPAMRTQWLQGFASVLCCILGLERGGTSVASGCQAEAGLSARGFLSRPGRCGEMAVIRGRGHIGSIPKFLWRLERRHRASLERQHSRRQRSDSFGCMRGLGGAAAAMSSWGQRSRPAQGAGGGGFIAHGYVCM